MTELQITRRPDGKLDIRGLALWSTGTFHGHGSPPEGDVFKTSDLDAMVTAHQEIGGNLSPRMYAGHPLNPTLKMLARPQGEIKHLRRDGKFLLADLDGVNAEFWRKAQEDNARFSPDVKLGHVDQRSGKTYPLSIVGLGVLGSVQPANGLLPSLAEYQTNYYSDARAYSEGDVRSYTGEILPAPAPQVVSDYRAMPLTLVYRKGETS